MEIETKEYSDGTTATGVGPLPELSPAQQDVQQHVPIMTLGEVVKAEDAPNQEPRPEDATFYVPTTKEQAMATAIISGDGAEVLRTAKEAVQEVEVFSSIKELTARLGRLIDHVNREIGVAEDVPLHMRLEALEKLVQSDREKIKEKTKLLD